MGKTKTAFVTGTTDEKLSSEEKYKLKQLKKAQQQGEKDKESVKGVGLKGGERIKVVGADEPIIETQTDDQEEKVTQSRWRKTRVRGKKYTQAKGKINKANLYDLGEAIKLVKETSYSKFDGTMELHLTVKKEGLSVNTTLPHSAGKSKKVELATDKTIEDLKKGKIDFDVLLATPKMMPKLVPFAKLLGPRGLMPNPKTQTLIKDEKDAKNFSTNTLTLKTEKKAPLIHTSVGKVSQKDSELEENVNEILKAIGPRQIVKAYLKSTMSPSVKLKI